MLGVRLGFTRFERRGGGRCLSDVTIAVECEIRNKLPDADIKLREETSCAAQVSFVKAEQLSHLPRWCCRDLVT